MYSWIHKTFPKTGNFVINSSWFSSLFAYALSQSGSDWCHARIRNVATGEDYPDKIRWIKFSSLNITPDNKGLFYQRFPEPVGVKDAGTETGINGNAMALPRLGYRLTVAVLPWVRNRAVWRYINLFGCKEPKSSLQRRRHLRWKMGPADDFWKYRSG